MVSAVNTLIARRWMSRLLSLAGLLLSLSANAGNVDLATVPERRTVQLTIYNAEDLTLVRETRELNFKPGVNPLRFSWANTLIDPTSVELRFPDAAGGLELLDTTLPHDKPQSLYWNVRSDTERTARIEISYFTSGIRWEADYLAIADPDERQLRLDSFVRVRNDSGEDYEDAQVRLVVGTLNLVEKIAVLARLPVGRIDELKRDEYQNLRQKAARPLMAAPATPAAEAVGMAADAAVLEAPKAIAKAGLSEYFIYSIEGTETVPNGWAKRLRSFVAEAVPMTVEYRYRPREYGEALTRLYLLRNDRDSHLGGTPLPDGRVRVFRADAEGGLHYLATQNLAYVPIGDRIELNLGADPAVLFKEVKERVYRDQFWLQIKGGTLYRKLGEEGLKLDVDSQVAGWDEHTVYRQEIRNYSTQPIRVQIRRAYDGDVLFRSRLNPTLHDFQTVQVERVVAAGEKAALEYEVVARMGYSQKQSRVEVQAGDPGR